MISKTSALSLPQTILSKLSLVAIGTLVALSLFGLAHLAQASVTPTLNLSSLSDGDSVQLNVVGDPNDSVVLYYIKSGVGSQFSVLGSTDAHGNYSTTVSSASYGIATATPVHVTVNGINGPSSSITNWPTVSGTTTVSQITLSQSGLVMTVGHTTTLSVSNNTTSNLYVSTNSNPSIANINLSGTTLTVSALATGTTTATVCAVGNTASCPALTVTVQNTGASQLSFSQSTANIVAGQIATVSISGGSGTYIISSNSNPNLVLANINGQSLSLSMGGTTSGTAAITVCSSNLGACGVVNVTAGVSGSTTVSFGTTNPSVAAGSVSNVTIYGGTTGVYYVSSNGSPSVVQANISGSTLSLTGLTAGTSTVNVCSSNGSCSAIVVSVTGSATGGIVTLSQTSVTLSQNNTIGIAISGGTAPYYLPVTSGSSIYQASISGSTLNLTGQNPGTATISVCSATGSCTSLYLTVSNGTTTTSIASFLSFSQTAPTVAVGQNLSVSILGGSGTYTLAFNSNPSAVMTVISGSMLSLTGQNNGGAVIVLCGGLNACGAIQVSVGTGSVTTTTTTPTMTTLPLGCSSTIGFSGVNGMSCNYGGTPILPTTVVTPVVTPIPVVTTPSYIFTSFLTLNTNSDEVKQLQLKLKSLGYFSGTANGNFGPLTEEAVIKFQKAMGLSQAGYVGPTTRAALNKS